MLKGKLEIDVYDKDGNLKQHEEGENLITNHTYDLIKNSLANKDLNILLTDSSNISSKLYATNIIPEFEGILLFDNLLIEDENNYFNQLMSAKEVGHAGSGTTTYEAKKSGSLNTTAQEITDNSIKKVWVFGQGKAAGTIQSVALTNTILGTKGIEDYDFIKNTEGKFITNVDKRYNIAQIYFNRFKTEEGKIITADYLDSGSIIDGIYPVAIKNSIVYCLYAVRSGNTLKIDIHKINLDDYYKKTSFSNYVFQTSSNARMARFLPKTTAENPDFTYSTEISSSNNYNDFVINSFDNKICIAMNTKANLPKIVEFDINTELFSETISPQQYEGVQYPQRYAVKTSKGIFFPSADGTSIAQFTNNLVFMQFLPLPEKLRTAANNAVPYLNGFDSNFFKCKFTSNNYNVVCLSDGVNFKFLENNGDLYDRGHINSDTQHLLPFMNYNTSNTGAEVYPRLSNMYISTIKNLTNPVVKGESDVMNVTYTIIKAD